MATRRILPALLLVSGFCGISYEILYAKLLGNLLGDRFAISAGVLLTFLFGIGMGTLYAHRFVRKLWAIEAGIGIYAACMVAGYASIDRLLYGWAPALGTSLAACMLVSIVLLAIPAFLVGCSVPLFAAYLATVRSRFVFSATYAVYNIGAALMTLVIEFVILRSVGIRAATLGMALLNVVVAMSLLVLVRSAPVIPAPRMDRLVFARRDLAALALVSVASAVFQLLTIKIAEAIIGPFNETFSLVLTVVLLGLALGSVASGRIGLTFRGAVVLAVAGLTITLASLGQIAGFYAALRTGAAENYALLVLLKFGLVALVAGLPAVGFGATVPALLRQHRDVARESGQLLFVSSMGNVAGFLLMAFVLHRQLDYGPLLLVIVGIAVTGLLIHSGIRQKSSMVALVLAALAVAAQIGWWNESLLYYGHHNFLSAGLLDSVKKSRFFADRFKGFQDVFAITWRNGQPSFFINGYNSIPLTSVSEKVAGALSVMAAPRTDNALVLGVGSGATAATVGLMFDHTDAVEINAVILKNLGRMTRHNFDLENMPQVTIIHDDGIRFVKTTSNRYSLIVNTVTTPIYFSSSKLYTKDFLAMVVSRLTPDGVYTTWVDRELGDRGVEIILETLSTAFETCWLAYLKSSYYLLTCSNGEIAARHVDDIEHDSTLSDYMRSKELLSGMIPYSLLSTDALGLRRGDSEPNTLDFPVLEHAMARVRRQKILDFNQRLETSIDLARLEQVLSGEMAWHVAGFALWGDMRTDADETLGGALRRIVATDAAMVKEYSRIALETAERIGTAKAYYRYGYRLFERHAYDASVAAFTRVTELEPENSRAHYYLARSHESLGDLDRAEASYAMALSLDPDDRSVVEALTRLGSTSGLQSERDTGDARPSMP